MSRLGVLVLVAGCSFTSNPPELESVPGVGLVSVAAPAIGYDGSVYIPTSGGIYIYEDGEFVLHDPHGDQYAEVYVDHRGSLYQAGEIRLAGSSTWTRPALPSGGTFKLMGESSENVVYLVEEVDGYSQIYRESDGGWIPIGDRVASFDAMHADKQGALWFENRLENLYVVRGSTVSFVRRSRELIGVGPDGTAYYFVTPRGALEGDYGAVLAVDQAGERVISRGECKDNGELECPHLITGNYLYDKQVGADFALYETVGRDNMGYRNMIMRMDDTGTWRPVISAAPTESVLQSFMMTIGSDSTVWVTGNGITTSSGNGGHSQVISGGAYRGHP